MTLSESAASGDRTQTLHDLRDLLASQLQQTTSGRDVAALSRQLVEVLDKIQNAPNRAEVSPADEIAKRRASRRPGAKDSARANRSG